MSKLADYEQILIGHLQRWSLPLLRISLGVVYVWFGVLKMAGTSPVFGLIQALHPEYPEPSFFMALGVWEVLIGLGFISGKFLRTTLVLMWAQMAGIMVALFTDPELFFQASNPLSLTYDGEFLVKNFVLIAASLVIAAFGLKPRAKMVS